MQVWLYLILVGVMYLIPMYTSLRPPEYVGGCESIRTVYMRVAGNLRVKLKRRCVCEHPLGYWTIRTM